MRARAKAATGENSPPEQRQGLTDNQSSAEFGELSTGFIRRECTQAASDCQRLDEELRSRMDRLLQISRSLGCHAQFDRIDLTGVTGLKDISEKSTSELVASLKLYQASKTIVTSSMHPLLDQCLKEAEELLQQVNQAKDRVIHASRRCEELVHVVQEAQADFDRIQKLVKSIPKSAVIERHKMEGSLRLAQKKLGERVAKREQREAELAHVRKNSETLIPQFQESFGQLVAKASDIVVQHKAQIKNLSPTDLNLSEATIDTIQRATDRLMLQREQTALADARHAVHRSMVDHELVKVGLEFIFSEVEGRTSAYTKMLEHLLRAVERRGWNEALREYPQTAVVFDQVTRFCLSLAGAPHLTTLCKRFEEYGLAPLSRSTVAEHQLELRACAKMLHANATSGLSESHYSPQQILEASVLLHIASEQLPILVSVTGGRPVGVFRGLMLVRKWPKPIATRLKIDVEGEENCRRVHLKMIARRESIAKYILGKK